MDKKNIILSGNPNVGKSSIFNLITGMHQHTGNWSGKTVVNSEGFCKYDKNLKFIDLPGTYSLMHLSEEELVARDSIVFDDYYKNIVVCDACSLERNFNLLLQILEINNKVILCLNQYDLAIKKNIKINVKELENILGVKVVLCSAKKKKGIKELLNCIHEKNDKEFKLIYPNLEEKIEFLESKLLKYNLKINTRFIALRLLEGDKTIANSIYKKYKIDILDSEINVFLRDEKFNYNNDIISNEINKKSNEIFKKVVSETNRKDDLSLKIDRIITKKKYGIPLSIIMLSIIFYITIVFANYPSEFLSNIFAYFGEMLLNLSNMCSIPGFIYEPLILGVYKTLTWVIAVMLPPMAIFFPLFALAEESGLLPRIAFNFDKIFKKCLAHGKQTLTMAMGFGCNACAIIGSRIIDSPRDKLIAVLTNNFIPCNGRFPLLIAIIGMFFVSSSIKATLVLVVLILIGIIMSLLISKLLSLTILKGIPSHFTLELPNYKMPDVKNVIIRSLFDKTLFVLGRAVKVAAPAGLLIYAFANIHIGNNSILYHVASFIDPFASLFGLDGIILLSFILALPANEIVLPIIIMGYLSTGEMTEMNNLVTLKQLLIDNGWTVLTAISVCLFSIMHFPCATTLLTIKKEVGIKWMIYSFLIPTITGLIFLFSINSIYNLLI